MNQFEIILFYQYVHIADPVVFRDAERVRCMKLGLKGRTIVAHEGLNATYEGTKAAIDAYVAELRNDPRFAATQIKYSKGTGNAFPKLSIKVRSEIVTLGLGEKDLNPTEVTGTHLKPEDLYEWMHKGEKEFYIVDMRNDYEHRVGHFKDSILPPLENFRDLPKVLPQLEHLKNKTVVTVCTGGVRCEKASGYLVREGFKDVYQLDGGIVTYMEKFKNDDFKGSLYVFDDRHTMTFTPDAERTIVGRCFKCEIPSEIYVNCANDLCHRHFICCKGCGGDGEVKCGKC
jgi:UPF0176 protein